MKDNRDIRTLCKRCRDEYENTGIYYIHRVDPKKKEFDDVCHKCQKFWGYDCVVTAKERRGKR